MPPRASAADEDLRQRLGNFGDPAGVVTAAAVTVDGLLAARADGRCDVLKVDAEGMELAVLRGAAKVLGGRRPPLVYVENDRSNRRACRCHSRLSSTVIHRGSLHKSERFGA
jgi:hypothetical protein